MFGIFDMLGEVMIVILNFFYGWTRSYGLSIILLTMAVKVVMFPLTLKQTKSMQVMQELQPKLKEIQEKYKDEPQVYQKKTMEMYREKGVNPAGGCLPLLVQMPIFIALFRVLQDFPELQDTSFLWINDLGGRDPVLIFLTAGTMFLQTFIQQGLTGGDQQANKMMYFMPLFIIFIGWNLPSGVLLYWFVSNLLMSLQQYIISNQPKTAKGEAS